ncbi:MAG TPA: hypothetical protein VN695_02145 [Streptosporangiaceae bacterium]|nr:hypothetical protein [Streptosporangiaceae bacterium]
MGLKGAILFSSFGRSGRVRSGRSRSGKVWVGVALSVSVVIAGTVVAGVATGGAAVAGHAAVTGKKGHHDNGGSGPVICRKDGRRTVNSYGVYYIVRNDVILRERECITLVHKGPGFVVTKTHADSPGGENAAFPEVLYGCEWGLCTKHSVLPRRITRLKTVLTSWDASWRRAQGQFNVAYDIWFGYLHTIQGHALGAEVMIWLGTKHFGTPLHAPILRIDGVRWYFGTHRACSIYGCWKYILFRRVVPATHAHRLGLMPFFHYAEQRRLLSKRWFLKSIDVGFEIWHQGLGLAVHKYSVRIKLHKLRHKRHRK